MPHGEAIPLLGSSAATGRLALAIGDTPFQFRRDSYVAAASAE